MWDPEANEPGEQGLVEVAVLLQGQVLHYRGELTVVPDQTHPLQTTTERRRRRILRATTAAAAASSTATLGRGKGGIVAGLEEHRDHCLHFQHLSCFLHHQIVVPEAQSELGKMRGQSIWRKRLVRDGI